MASKKHLALLKKAENAIGWKQYPQAIKAYDEAIKAKSNCVEAWNGKGQAWAELKEWDQAIAAFDKVIKLKPDSLDGYLNKATTLEESNRNAEAEELYRSAVDAVPDHKGANFLFGTYLNRQKRYLESIEVLNQAIDSESDPIVLMARAFALEQTQQYALALADVNLVMVYGDFFVVYHTKGQLLEKLGRDEDALETYHRGMQADPNPVLLLNKTYLLEKLNRPAEAQRMYDIERLVGFECGVPHRGLELKSQVYHKLKRYDDAIAIYYEILEMTPDNADMNADTYYELGICYAEKGDLEAAETYVRKACAIGGDLFKSFVKDEPSLGPIREQVLDLIES